MKNLFAVFFILLAFISCGQKQEEPGTKYKDVDVARFEQLINESENEIVLDVRTPAETKEGTIPGAIEYNYFGDDFKAKLHELDKNKPVLVYCASGGRSGKTMSMMKEMGFKEVYNLKGGYKEWKERNESGE